MTELYIITRWASSLYKIKLGEDTDQIWVSFQMIFLDNGMQLGFIRFQKMKFFKKCLKIPKGVIRIHIYQRRTENTMTKRTNNDLQNMHIKLKISVTRTRHPWCWSSYKASDKSWMRKGPESAYNKWNISVVFCDTDIP